MSISDREAELLAKDHMNRMGQKLRETYRAAYADATGTPYQRQIQAWAAVYLRAKELP